MDANFCRCLFPELIRRLEGARIDKVFTPAPDVWTFDMSAGGGVFLLFRHDRKQPLFFLSSSKPDNPTEPSARSMWFRKRLKGGRLVDGIFRWHERRMAWRVLTPGAEDTEKWLCLDLREGPELTPEQPFEAGDPDWPALDDVRSDPEVWRSHPQITPALRRSLKTLDRDQALAVYRHVSLGSCENFYVYTGGRGQAAYPWRLPESLREGLEERVHDSALDAARDMGERLLFQDLSQRSAEPGRKRIEQRLKRIEKNLGNLDRDVERLTELRGFKEDGEAIKAVLHEYGPEAKMERIEVPVSQGGFRTLELDSKLTLLENMERSFKLAAKGRRGLEFAKSRRRALEKELAETRDGGVPPEAEPKPPRGKGKETSPAESPKGVAVHVFETDDGFTLYRGKNSKANHELLSRLAGRHDLWFHARGVSGSHVVLKRDHPGQEVPERSLRQAAAVAGMASGFSGAGRAEVVCALVKDLRKRKGAGHGLVAVDKEYRSLVVDLDEKEIQRLKR